MQLSDKYPFLINYFDQAVKEKSNIQSILFYGNDLNSQFELALHIAKMLNCTGVGGSDCNCINCHWIEENQHPAVKTISRLDNKPEDDESKTVISVKQAQMIKASLANISDYHRVFVFCDRDKEENISGLNPLNFQEETANSLLKVIEEPPEKTTFIFLTRDKNDVLGTILSRCMSFFVPSFEEKPTNYTDIKDIFENYFEFERLEVFDVAKKLTERAKEVNSTKILEQIQNYMLQLLKSNFNNKKLGIKIIQDMKFVETAKKQLALNMNEQNVFEDLCLNMIK